MFHDLDNTLGELLKRELPSSLLAQDVKISFATPDGQFAPSAVSLPAINLFLYEIAENRDLRTQEPELERQVDGRVIRTPAPARIDCHYLVTAWSKATVLPELDEHQMLGETIRVLLRHKEIPKEALRGSLITQPFPVRARVSPPSAQQTRGDFWQALGGKPRAAFHYVVTVAVDLGQPEDAGKLTFVSVG